MIPAEPGPWTPDDLETLAAFVEGRLDSADRERVEERLTQDPAFAEVLAEALLVWDDDQDERAQDAPEGHRAEPSTESRTEAPSPFHRPGSALESRRARRSWRPLALAASLVLAVALVLMFKAPAGPGTDWTAGLTDPSLIADSRWTSNGLPTDRGFGETAGVFELGVLWADFRLAESLARVEDKEALHQAADRARQRFIGAAADGAFARISRYLEIAWEDDPATAIESTEPVLLDALSARGPDVRAAFAAGRWAESARLVAVAADEKQLRRIWRQRQVFEAFASRHRGPGGALADLESSFAEDLDLVVIEEQLREVIRLCTAG